MASVGLNIPVRIKATMMPIDVKSTGSFSVISKSIAITKITVTSQMAMSSPHRKSKFYRNIKGLYSHPLDFKGWINALSGLSINLYSKT
jgi:hypothetical protein